MAGFTTEKAGKGMPWAVLWLLLAVTAVWSAEPELREYETPYYTIHTDLEIELVGEAAVRMTRMAEEYSRRTEGFGGRMNRRMPFYLYKQAEDYYAAGGVPGSGGLFNGQKLMAIAGSKGSGWTWQVVQHEGFHQFAKATIGRTMPIWVEEGLAEYFGQAVFTGDGYVTGLIPPSRLSRVKKAIEAGQFKGVEQMMLFSRPEWNSAISNVNYDQGWSMLHFLAHGDGGRYQPLLVRFLNDLSGGGSWADAWVGQFGRDVAAFEKRWREYWLELSANPTADLYAQATCATLTSFLARAGSQQQAFADFEGFRKAAEAGQLKHHAEDWLPPALLADALRQAGARGEWSLEQNGARLACKVDETTTWLGTFSVRSGRVGGISIAKAASPPPPATQMKKDEPAPPAATRPAATPGRKVDPVAAAMNLARAYSAAGNIEKARDVLQRAIAENPQSAEAERAKAMLKELK